MAWVHHDSFVVDISSLSGRFENGDFENSWLLGDSGYSLKPWLMTLYARPASDVERKYNLLHRKTRRLIRVAIRPALRRTVRHLRPSSGIGRCLTSRSPPFVLLCKY